MLAFQSEFFIFAISLFMKLSLCDIHVNENATAADVHYCNKTLANRTENYRHQSPCYCPAEKYETSFGTFHFPETPATTAGVKTRVACPYGKTGVGMEPISSFFATRALIDESDSGSVRICRLLSSTEFLSTSKWEKDIQQPRNCRTTALENVVRNLKVRIDNFEVNHWNWKTIWAEVNSLLFTALSPPGDYKTIQILIEAFGSVLNSYNVDDEGADTTPAAQCFAILEELSRDVPLVPGYRVTVESPFVTMQTAQFPYNNSESNLMNYTAQLDNVELKFPSDVLQMSLDQQVTQPKLRIMAYSDNLFIHWKDEIQRSTTTARTITIPGNITSSTVKTTTTSMAPGVDPSDNNDTALAGHWRVFSIDVLHAKIADLETEFEYTFHPENISAVGNFDWKCVFWNESEHMWSTKGIKSVINNDSITCKAAHFTAFSVLIDPLPLPIPGSDYAPIQNSVHSKILSNLSSIGSAISIVGLAGVILTYGMFRSLRRERSNRILLNLSIALFLMHLISISSAKEFWDGHCLIPSMLLQYFLHSSLFWMLMEAHHMYQLLISVFVKPETRFLIKRCLIAWGIPLVIVGICAAIRPEVYWTGRHDLCIIAAHLNLPLYYAAYMAPIIIILFVNLLVFCRIFRVLYKQTLKQKQGGGGQKKVVGGGAVKSKIPETDLSKKVAENIRKTKYVMLSPTQIKGAVTVMILVGAGWVVGLFAIGPFEVFFKYLFCITNAGQGALIFLFRVVLHPQACREWRKLVLGLKMDSSSEVSTTSSTNINTTHRKSKVFVSTSPGFISASNSVENSLTPSDPDAKDLARTLASMMRSSEGPPKY